MSSGSNAAIGLVSLVAVVAMKFVLLDRMYERRRRHGGSRTATVPGRGPRSNTSEWVRDQVDFVDFGDSVRYSPHSVLVVQNVAIFLLASPLVAIIGFFCWALANVHRDHAVALFATLAIVVSATLAWAGRRLWQTHRRAQADARLQRVGIRRSVDSFRVERVGFHQGDGVYIVIACWTDDARRTWETRCGPIAGDPSDYFHRHLLRVLQDPERTEDSRIDPTFLPLVNGRGLMDPKL